MKNQTKRSFVTIFIIIAIWLHGVWTGHLFWPRTVEPNPEPITVIDTVLETEPTLHDHIAMIVPDKLQDICRAIIWVESRGNSEAYRKSGNCVGILQLTPIYVRECNRLQSDIAYTLEDRTDIVKSLEMFTIYQNRYNPRHDIHKAIEIHNPTAGPEYKAKVLESLKTIY